MIFKYFKSNKTKKTIISSLSLGGNHSSALTYGGRVFVWGSNKHGQLGDGSILSKLLPTDITSTFQLSKGDKIVEISLGFMTTYALSFFGKVFLWGKKDFPDIGDKNRVNSNDPKEIFASLSPELFGDSRDDSTINYRTHPFEITSKFPIDSSEKITSISTGSTHYSALTSTGRVFMWGRNEYFGKLGDGTRIDRQFPIEITSRFSLALADKVVQINLQEERSSALTLSGRVFMWGRNFEGILGDGTSIDRLVPTEITSKFHLDTSDKVISLSLGHSHSIAFTKNGRLFTWGNNKFGVLGTPSKFFSFNYHHLPTEITNWFKGYKITKNDKFDSIYSGYDHSAALTSIGRVFMWGHNHYGQLGDGSPTSSLGPIEITQNFSLIRNEKIKSLYMNSDLYGRSAALTSHGRVFMWGSNDLGQLGNGTETSTKVPILINFSENIN